MDKSLNDLLQSLPNNRGNALKDTLEKLIKHIDPKDAIFCGSLSKRYYFLNEGIPYNGGEFGDLDVLVSERNVVKPSIMQDFAMCHYHIYQDNTGHLSRFYLLALDKKNNNLVDIFDAKRFYQDQTEPILVSFDESTLRFLSAEDQLVIEALEAESLLEGEKQQRKKLDDMEVLRSFVNMALAEQYWQKQNHKFKGSLTQALDAYKKMAQEQPELVVAHKIKRTPYECELCNPPEEFPLIPMAEFNGLLGYVV